MSGIYSVALSGINAAMAGLTTTSHNISNANVTGYNRQQVVQGTQDPIFTGVGFFGQGTRVDSVKRIYSEFLQSQVLTADTTRSENQSYYNEIKQVDNMLGDASSGVATVLQSFFVGIQQVANDAASIPARTTMLTSSSALVTRLHAMSTRLEEIRKGIEGEIQQSVTDINSLAKQIGDINQKILVAQSAGVNVPANDLQDQRNALIADLNKQVQVTTTTQSDGSISVFIGTGQPLVAGGSVYALSAAPSINDATRVAVGIALPGGGSVQLPEKLVTGGTLGGLLRVRSEALDTAENALGRITVGLTESINAQHKLGQDLNGLMGGNYFTPLSPTVQNLPYVPGPGSPTAALSTSFTNVSALTTDDYELSFDGTNYSMRRASDGGVVYSGATLPTNVNGISVSLSSGTINAGDRFLIQPTRYASQNVQMAISDPRLIAAASPFRSSADTSNIGTGSISAGTVNSLTGIAATVPHISNVVMTFDAATNQFNVTIGGVASGAFAYNPATDAPGKTFSVGTPDISVVISGVPKNGDIFRMGSNTAGVSDNRNALALGLLQTKKILDGGGASFEFANSEMVATVGAQTAEAKSAVDTQTSLLAEATSTQQELSGVNLDEEAANLLRYQQAYQASAKALNIASSLFNEILQIAR